MLSLFFLVLLLSRSCAQVTATFPNGPTNPDVPAYLPVGATVNQSSHSRLLSLNGVDDFCLYGPPELGPDSWIGDVEDIVVAYCTKPRNGARLIPDGTITSAHFIKTPLYVQIHGLWDGTKVNILAGDKGGELDPHGPENLGNPIGGNVTSDISGLDIFYEEWMSFVSYDEFCLRVCTAQTDNISAALQCEHQLDVMGCPFVMAIDNLYTTNNSFTSCEGEPAEPPGLYPQFDGSTSTFRQRYTGSYTSEGTAIYYTVGNTITPNAPALYPKTSNCVTYSTISNGIDPANYYVTAIPGDEIIKPARTASTSLQSTIVSSPFKSRSTVPAPTFLAAPTAGSVAVIMSTASPVSSRCVYSDHLLLAFFVGLICLTMRLRRRGNRSLRMTGYTQRNFKALDPYCC